MTKHFLRVILLAAALVLALSAGAEGNEAAPAAGALTDAEPEPGAATKELTMGESAGAEPEPGAATKELTTGESADAEPEPGAAAKELAAGESADVGPDPGAAAKELAAGESADVGPDPGEARAVLAAGELAEVELDPGAVYAFTAPSGSVYGVWLFPAGEAPIRVHAELWQGGELLAEGDEAMPALSLRLTAGAEYELRLSGEGRARLEITRHALSRCYAQPLPLDADGDVYAKAFARAGDAHWYALDPASDEPVALVGVPAEGAPRLRAQLFDDGGRLLAEAVQTPGGACLLGFAPEAGRRYCLRLTAEADETGLYELRLSRGNGAAELVTVEPGSATLSGRSAVRLAAGCAPEGAGGAIYWESSDPSVARVSADGTVRGRSGGEATVTAYAVNGVSGSSRVTVEYVPVASVGLLSGRMALNVGDDAAIECEVLPANASDPRLSYAVDPEGVVEVDSRGVLRAVAEGEATVTVRALDGGLEDALTVTVGPAPRRWRALLVGEQNYASTVASVRTGSVNSVAGLRSMLEGLSFSGARMRVSTLLDASRDGVLAGLEEAFAQAGERDVSLFYITCHGSYSGGMTYFKMYDGSVLSAAELARALGAVKGEILVILDCCGSGGAIARASETSDILAGIDAVFGGTVGPAMLESSRFKVLASAALEQDSYRISFADASSESGMSTVFARALCEAGGWSLERSARSAMRADADFDGRLTLNELYVYVSRRVMWYLNLTDPNGAYVQSVQVWPEGDGTVVFER